METKAPRRSVDLEQLVAEADTGGRKPDGVTGRIIFGVALAWSLFQLWYASPLPFMLGFGIFGDTEARAFHLSFALFLAFMAYPAFTDSSRRHVPLYDWLLAALAIAAVLYLVVFYQRHLAASGPADAVGHHRRGRRRRAAARSLAPRRRPVDADHRHRGAALRVRRPLICPA